MDELAHAAAQDPIAFRLAMLEGAETVKAGGRTIDRGAHDRECVVRRNRQADPALADPRC